MNIWFADNNSFPLWAVKKYGLKILCSYTYKQSCEIWFERGVKIFLDSGAFSAWAKGSKIDIDDYIKFYHQYKNYIEVVVALDVIPPSFEYNQIERSAEEGWENFQYMKSRGVPCIHVYHQGEGLKWLRKIADESDYFGISPNDKFPGGKLEFLKTAFSNIPKESKTHGFGVASDKFLGFPFYSIDSSKAIIGQKFMRILVPVDGKMVKFTLGKKRTKDHISNIFSDPVLSRHLRKFLDKYDIPISILMAGGSYKMMRIVNALGVRELWENSQPNFKKQLRMEGL